MSIVERWVLKPALLFRQDAFPFTVDAETARDDAGEYFPGVCHEGEATILSTLRPSFLLVQHLDRCTFPLWRHAPSPPHNDDDVVDLHKGVRITFVTQDLQEFRREVIWP